jgi:hypothetical protein
MEKDKAVSASVVMWHCRMLVLLDYIFQHSDTVTLEVAGKFVQL